MLNDGKIFFRCLEIQAYGFRNIKCLMKANNIPIKMLISGIKLINENIENFASGFYLDG